ncbi:MAG: hypothetical protein J5507_06900 [Clostridia bacterium]|nr:hypothetical protein [Clostridia bacterium]
MELNEIINILNKELKIENEVLMQNMEKKNTKISELEQENINLKNENSRIKQEYEKIQQEYNKIVYSRSYKLTQKLVKLIKK